MSSLPELQETCAHDTLRNSRLILSEDVPDSSDSEFDWDSSRYHITFDHLHPLTVDLCRGVDLNKRGLLCLATS